MNSTKFFVISLLFILVVTLFFQGNCIGVKLNVTYNPLQNGTDVLISENEPVIGIVKDGNTIIIGFLSKITALDVVSGNILWTIPISSENGLYAFLWKIIPNSLNSISSGCFISLSNGSVCEISTQGQVIWNTFLGPSAISNLKLVQVPSDVNHSFYIVAGGEKNGVYWLTPSGEEVENYDTSSEITVIETEGIHTIIGTRDGTIFVFNGTTELWSKDVGNSQVLAVGLYQRTVIAYSYTNPVFFLDLETKQVIQAAYYGLLTYNSIYILDQESDCAYFVRANGDLLAIQISNSSIIWENTNITSYARNIQFLEMTGDQQEELVIGTISGHLIVINYQTGSIIHSERIVSEELSQIIPSYINSDQLIDLIIGTLNGKVIIYFGRDVVPPIIVKLEKNSLSYNSFSIIINTDEPSRVEIMYGLLDIRENTMSNQTYSFNHSIVLKNLEPESEYFVQVTVYDETGNSAASELFIIKTDPAPTPFPIIEGLIVLCLVLVLLGGMFLYRQRIQQRLAFEKGEEALKDQKYVEAIRFFYRAKAKDKINEIVLHLIQTPSLSSYVEEIQQIKELEDYITNVRELIRDTDEK